jgi:hypothetical protein
MYLRIKEIRTSLSLSDKSGAAIASTAPANVRFDWAESSRELMRGLDVYELSVDLLLPDIGDSAPSRTP